MAVTSLGAMQVGSIVKLNVSGTPKNFLIPQQETGQTAVIVEDIWKQSNWDDATTIDCTEFFKALDADIQGQVIGKEVFLPTFAEANGGWSHFSADALRVAAYNGRNASWWLDSFYYGEYAYCVSSSGNVEHYWANSSGHAPIGVRPALYLPNTLWVTDDGFVAVNAPPEIASPAGASGTDLGTKTEGFDLAYSISDADGDALTITEKLDGEAQRTFPAASGTVCTFEVVGSAEQFRRILNGSHTLAVEASDGQTTTVYTATFEKSVTEASIHLKTPLTVEGDITVAVLAITGKIPEDAVLKVEVTNNANDPEPVWQDCTREVLAGNNIVFENHTCVNGAAFSFCISVERGPSGVGGYISAVTGAFQ